MHRSFLKNRSFLIAVALLVIGGIVFMMFTVGKRPTTPLITTIVETGPVRQLVSVSGITEAKQSADLAFPVAGTITKVLVTAGSVVDAGDILAILDSRALQADRQEALAALTQAIATRDELLQGPTVTARDVTTETIAAKQTALESVQADEAQKIANAYRTLLATDLVAYSLDADEAATPPIISGTYSCNEEGTYKIAVFRSAAESGYSFRVSGLELGTFSASTAQPTPFGSCGLLIQFDAISRYTNSEWFITIPNTRSASYTNNRNAYTLVTSQAETAISQATQALAVAKADATNQNAPARTEAITRANASIAQAQARLARIDAMIADHTLTAPFAGTVTDVNIVAGETVTTAPVITLLGEGAFTVTARIPEIDISKLEVGQATEMLFDARTAEVLSGRITFISPEATEIDGVAYFEATIVFDETPTWIRSGLNADIDIIITETSEGFRIPKRFITETPAGFAVLMNENNTTTTTTVEVLLEGNDGFIAVTGITSGDILVAP
jgi:HlyD family secretion protein